MTVKKMISYRSVWMGVAILWIMLFHSQMSLPFPLDYLILIGYGGVDIFLFASGVGNYYSYLRDEAPLEFFKRRLYKLAPIYIPIILIWCLYYMLCNDLSLWAVIGNISGIQILSKSGDAFSWYVTGMLICYLITPYLAKFVQTNKLINNLLLVFSLILISLCFVTDERLIILMTRLPIYATGMVVAKNEDINIRKRAVLLILGFLIGNIALFLSIKYAAKYIWSHGLYWYPFILITPGFCWMISELSSLCEKCFFTKLVCFFRFLGTFTFEMFLVHSLLLYVLDKRIDPGHYTNWIRFGIMIAALIIAFLYSYLVKQIKNHIKTANRTIS